MSRNSKEVLIRDIDFLEELNLAVHNRDQMQLEQFINDWKDELETELNILG